MIKQTDVSCVREQGCRFDIMTKLGLLQNCIGGVFSGGQAGRECQKSTPLHVGLVLYVIHGMVV